MHALPASILLLALTSACAARGSNLNAQGHATPAPAAAAAPAADEADGQSPRELLGELAAVHEGDAPLTHNGYEVRKEVLSAKLASGHADETEYVVVSRGGKPRLKLEGLTAEAAGPFVRFGLFPVLGDGARQLVVEQEIHRGWRHWVVDLSSDRPRVVFDSGDYPVGHALRAADLDGDGRFELIQNLHTFWFFNFHKTNWLDNTNSPLIEVVFKYDPAAREYVPANHEFRDFALRGVGRATEQVRRERERLRPGGPTSALLGAVLEVSLSHLYAGRAAEGWEFYERQYDSPDREDVKAQVRKALASDPVYRAITRRGRRAAARRD